MEELSPKPAPRGMFMTNKEELSPKPAPRGMFMTSINVDTSETVRIYENVVFFQQLY